MHRRNPIWFVFRSVLTALCLARAGTLLAGDTNLESQLRLLQQQNDALQSQLRQQQQMIDALSKQVSEIRESNAKQQEQVEQVKTAMKENEEPKTSSDFHLGNVHLSGEGGVGFFETGREGMFPHNEFRLDEAKLFVDASVWGDTYAYAEINLTTREQGDVALRLGEMYLDVEDISKLWGRERQLNLRAGRLSVPFGEEYLERNAIDDPLVSHSLADFWGWDEGVELYGSLDKFCYVLAVQNGGNPDTADFTSDKSVAARLSYDPLEWLHLSVSGMRTGDISPQNDGLSALWFGNGWFRSIGSSSTTAFHANLIEGDVAFNLPRGHVKTFGGYIRYDDNDPLGRNGRDIYFYSIEGQYDVTKKFYAAGRFSQILAPKGYPITGNGMMSDYFFNYSPGALTDNLWRLSLGLGYRWNRHLLVKAEYSLERGKEVGGDKRDHEDLFATEAAFGF
jgi:hypothetical protein